MWSWLCHESVAIKQCINTFSLLVLHFVVFVHTASHVIALFTCWKRRRGLEYLCWVAMRTKKIYRLKQLRYMENECTTHIRRLNHVTQMAKRITDNSLNCNPTIGAIHFFWLAGFISACLSFSKTQRLYQGS